MCVHLCNSKFGGLILLVSLDFKTLWKMFTERGEYVAHTTCLLFISQYYCELNDLLL